MKKTSTSRGKWHINESIDFMQFILDELSTTILISSFIQILDIMIQIEII